MEALSGLMMREVKLALKAIAWRKVREVWREEARGRSKLVMIGKLMDYECKARCVEVDCKRQRSMLAKLRGGTAELRIETGTESGEVEVEDVEHLVMKYAHVKEERGKLMR